MRFRKKFRDWEEKYEENNIGILVCFFLLLFLFNNIYMLFISFLVLNRIE